MTLDEELQSAYAKLNKAEEDITRLSKRHDINFQVQEILIAAGFLTRNKIKEAEAIIRGLHDEERVELMNNIIVAAKIYAE